MKKFFSFSIFSLLLGMVLAPIIMPLMPEGILKVLPGKDIWLQAKANQQQKMKTNV